MPLENERIAYTRQWLEKVRKDLRVVTVTRF